MELNTAATNPVVDFLKALVPKLDSRNFYDAPLDQYVEAISLRARLLVLIDDLEAQDRNHVTVRPAQAEPKVIKCAPPKPDLRRAWTPEQVQSFADIMAARRCSRIQAIHLHKRGNLEAPLTDFSHARSQPTERMADFAKENRLRLVDTGAERVVPGKYGQLADMNDDGLLRLRLLAQPRGANMDRTLRSRRAKALAGGLSCKWQGDAESICYFDPANAAQVQLALNLVGAKKRRVRVMSTEQKEALVARLAAGKSQQSRLAA